jgi:hypothetical protein
MCDACMEMELYFAYQSEVEARKAAERQAAQPWQCEVTVFPQDAAVPASTDSIATAQAKSKFVCDVPE